MIRTAQTTRVLPVLALAAVAVLCHTSQANAQGFYPMPGPPSFGPPSFGPGPGNMLPVYPQPGLGMPQPYPTPPLPYPSYPGAGPMPNYPQPGMGYPQPMPGYPQPFPGYDPNPGYNPNQRGGRPGLSPEAQVKGIEVFGDVVGGLIDVWKQRDEKKM